jgi:pyruvate dehydrogenase E2 component (dihydrolipoamide acetyltransferase)
MSGRLRLANVALGLVGCLLVAGLGRELLSAHPLPPPPVPRPARPVAPTAAAATATPPPAEAAYGVIAAKNLFSPSRSEAQAGPAVAAGPKPVLHGVVMDGPKSRAYLEDPVLKRTFGYVVGDTVGGGRVDSIAVDRVVIGLGDGLLEVLLHDPSKPKPAPTAAAPAPAAPAPGPAGQAGPAPAVPAPATRIPVPISQAERR